MSVLDSVGGYLKSATNSVVGAVKAIAPAAAGVGVFLIGAYRQSDWVKPACQKVADAFFGEGKVNAEAAVAFTGALSGGGVGAVAASYDAYQKGKGPIDSLKHVGKGAVFGAVGGLAVAGTTIAGDRAEQSDKDWPMPVGAVGAGIAGFVVGGGVRGAMGHAEAVRAERAVPAARERV